MKAPDSVPIRHFYLKPRLGSDRGGELCPYFYVEAKIDMADIRSGFRESLSVSRALEMVPLEGDVLWTEDMVRPIDPSLVGREPPPNASARPLPSTIDAERLRWIESQFLSYLLRHFEVRIFRNPFLNLYSFFGESLEDFRERCCEALLESFRGELDGLREVFGRRLEQLKQKYLPGDRWGDFAEDPSTSRMRDRMHEMSERLADLFLRASLKPAPGGPPPVVPEIPHEELAGRLVSLHAEAFGAIRKIASSFAERAETSDEYLVRPTLKGIRMGGVSILWIPVESHP